LNIEQCPFALKAFLDDIDDVLKVYCKIVFREKRDGSIQLD